MLPRSIRRVTDLPPSAKLREMQQNTHGLVQLIRATKPDGPHQRGRSISPTAKGKPMRRTIPHTHPSVCNHCNLGQAKRGVG